MWKKEGEVESRRRSATAKSKDFCPQAFRKGSRNRPKPQGGGQELGTDFDAGKEEGCRDWDAGMGAKDFAGGGVRYGQSANTCFQRIFRSFFSSKHCAVSNSKPQSTLSINFWWFFNLTPSLSFPPPTTITYHPT